MGDEHVQIIQREIKKALREDNAETDILRDDIKRICKRCRFGCSAFYTETLYCRHQKAKPTFNYVSGEWIYDTCEFVRDKCKGDWFEKWNLFKEIFRFFSKKEKLIPQNKVKKQFGFRPEEKGDSK